MSMDFFQTKMGYKFFEADVPRIAKALETIASCMEKGPCKVIKVITRTGLCCQDYGADVIDDFATGSKDHCLEAIRKDILFMEACKDDSGSKLIFVNGADIEDDLDDLEGFVVENTTPEATRHVIRLQADDLYDSIFEITYQIISR